MSIFPKQIINQMQSTGVVTGFSVSKADHAVPIAEALVEGGLNVIELTLRTDSAIDEYKI